MCQPAWGSRPWSTQPCGPPPRGLATDRVRRRPAHRRRRGAQRAQQIAAALAAAADAGAACVGRSDRRDAGGAAARRRLRRRRLGALSRSAERGADDCRPARLAAAFPGLWREPAPLADACRLLRKRHADRDRRGAPLDTARCRRCTPCSARRRHRGAADVGDASARVQRRRTVSLDIDDLAVTAIANAWLPSNERAWSRCGDGADFVKTDGGARHRTGQATRCGAAGHRGQPGRERAALLRAVAQRRTRLRAAHRPCRPAERDRRLADVLPNFEAGPPAFGARRCRWWSPRRRSRSVPISISTRW